MSGTTQQSTWVERVLGVSLGTAQDGPTNHDALAAWTSARLGFEEASTTVSQQIEQLRRALLAYEDDDDLMALGESAAFGLNAFTGNTRVKLMAALLAVRDDDPAGLRDALPAVVEAARAMQGALEASEEVAVCDDNPFGVTVSIRATLGVALEALQSAGTRLQAG